MGPVVPRPTGPRRRPTTPGARSTRAPTSTSSRVAADVVVVGRIATLAGPAGPGWAEAVAIAAGRVVAAGSLGEVETVIGPGTRRLDLARDEVAVPGLTDAHLHLADAALERLRVTLEGCTSIEELIAVVGSAALEPGLAVRVARRPACCTSPRPAS